MTEQKDVAYRRLGDKVIYFTWNADGYKCSCTPYAGRTYDGLFDGNEAGEALWLSDFDRAFLFASPRTKNYNEFVKAVCFKVYMNPWTKDECQRFADAMKLEDQDEWLRRFNLVGGKPRFLFSSSETFDDLVQRVKEDISHNLDELKTKFGFSSRKCSMIG
ncbi:D-amino acid dehydrogenase small subunit [Phytophthora nicotianae]|nr:D-amino acid dehydrogenase small subunit [Phytophthora nicotianae]